MEYRVILHVRRYEHLPEMSSDQCKNLIAHMIHDLNHNDADSYGFDVSLVQVDEGTASTMIDPIVPTPPITNLSIGGTPSPEVQAVMRKAFSDNEPPEPGNSSYRNSYANDATDGRFE